MLARTIIPIDCPSWRNVDVQLKEKLWLDILETFKVSKKLKKGVLKSASAKWRQFKTNLNRKFVKPNLGQKKKLRKPPNQYAFVGKEAWKKFVAQRITDDWKSLSEQQSNRVRKRKYPHCMSRKGYIGLLEEEQKKGNLKPGEKPDRITKAELLARDRERDAELEKAKQEMERTRQEMERTREEMVQALKAMGLANIPSPKLSQMASCGQKVASPSVVKDLDQLLVDDDDCVPIKPIPPENKGPRKSIISSYMAYLHSKGNPDRLFLLPHNTNCHWILVLMWGGEIFVLNPLPRSTTFPDLEKSISRAVVAFNIQAERGNKAPIVKYLSGCPKQPGGIKCGYVVMRYMKEIVMDSEMSFLKKWSAKSRKLSCSRAELDEGPM
ncbi:hypothetical protein POM88_037628 [Heracleum sosnowskyi]|uniref:Ubiquitin-like protease family profile domain-containing protein n=1 Tax=Heracleum sosnowskyi TaxID=360622 RepID=A0AAD8MFH8_9APIA|nr:hypothetical protein POM88_037628 [Heracleum sosnowskyi]